jgi:multidrug efflux system membrane fusion protein
LKGTFANAHNRLWPGQFVNVRLTLSVQSNALIVPTSAVQTGQDGQYVFVVKPDNTVEMRPVVVDRGVGDETILSRGVARGETVVTDGQLRLGPGARIEIKRPVQMESDKEPPARTSKKAG